MKLLSIEDFCLDAPDMPEMNGAFITFEQKQGYRIVSENEINSVNLIKAIAGIQPDHIQQGTILFKGIDVYNCSENKLKEIKREMAYVFREGTLISNLTVRENLLLPTQHLYPGKDIDSISDKGLEYLHYFSLENILEQRPAELSYAAKKKISFVRAALLEPQLILIDKPMFNLEAHDRKLVLNFLQQLKEQGVSLIMVSQFPSLISGLIDETIVIEKIFRDRKVRTRTAGEQFKELR